MIFPKNLKVGDTIGIIAPASPFTKYSLEDITVGFKDLGYKIKFGDSVTKSYKGYLAGPDEIRAKDIENMFLDSEVDAILCIRGGYGTPRLLDIIDYNIIANNPKLFIGFSDITALHIAFNQIANLSTIHGIMAGNILEWDSFTYKSFIDAVTMKNKLEITNPRNEKLYTLIKGKCAGEIIGGNLSLLVATMGSEYEINTKGKILFIEEVGECIYRIDRMLTQLSLAGKFDDCEGIIFGNFSDCNKNNLEEFEIIDILLDRVKKYNKPCIYNLQSGHCMPMISIPLGTYCKLDATNKIIKLLK